MKRPFLSSSIDDLENALEQAILSQDGRTVQAIARELQHRRVPRARDLAERIENLNGDAGAARTPERNIQAKSANSSSKTATGSLPPSGRKPTAQQDEAISAFAGLGSLRINAFAGSGKTSTLQMLSHATGRRGQYIAFNKSIVSDAKEKFPSTVDCSTTHSLAFRAAPQAFKQNGLAKMTDRIGAQKLAEILELKKSWRIDADHSLLPRSQAYLIIETVKRYAQSADDEIGEQHVPQHGSLLTAPPESLAAVKDFATRGAAHVWARMCNPTDELPLGHDGYLKLWSLSRPRIAADFILLDEAQDTNAVVLDVLRRQSAQLVYVGDRWQQIYEWRGAINAMEAIDTDHSVSLTQSFRFGPEIAAAASSVISRLGETQPLIGNPKLASRVGACRPDALLARTNANVIKALVEALDQSRAPHLVGGTGELMEMLRGVSELKEGQPCSTVPEFFGFANWEEVVDFSKQQEGEHLVTFVNLVESMGERRLMWALNRSVAEEKADLVLSTAHKAKGREWDNVQLTDDFLKSRPSREETSEQAAKRERDHAAELRLFYVAVTRAKKTIDIPPALAETLGLAISAPQAAPPTKRRDSVTEPLSRVDIPGWSKPVDWKPPSKEAASSKSTIQGAPAQRKGFLARLFGL